ncbi:hypothetical protein [Ureibacillus aquaedulcis]|uniref:Uncharacterized protein n=1 Tax=Ureibacillus aquaedulcis TaxID=3058421 RepID=A0ABT8GL68_9BACL|nr:hypothetical protein [Ureibacillus sp. BA0131]MDN4492155.1 hypothetical protein [Ureibacillus sp. BA0131]
MSRVKVADLPSAAGVTAVTVLPSTVKSAAVAVLRPLPVTVKVFALVAQNQPKS